jgi:hypothetical protein
MDTQTNLSFWIDRVVGSLVVVALLGAALYATVSSSLTSPAVQWAKVAAEQLLASVVG